MTVTIDGTNGITYPSNTIQNTAYLNSFKNRIINGAMMIDQRNAGASVGTTTLYGNYTLDRWQAEYSVVSKFTVQQNAGSVATPVGFINYLGVTSSSSYSVGSSESFGISQNIEGLNIADLAWGTANAKTITLSFQVYSSLTGTFGGSLRNSATNRSYPFSYTISSANTWTSISITINGDTTGTWLTTNGIGIRVYFSLGSGSSSSSTAGSWSAGSYTSATSATSVVGTNGATWYVTGVQLEVGSAASSFDVRDYGRELYLCRRYAVLLGDGLSGIARSATEPLFLFTLPQQMRATPANSSSVIINSAVTITDNYSQDFTSSGSTISIYSMSSYGGRFSITGFSGLTTGRWYGSYGNTNGYFVLLSAEL